MGGAATFSGTNYQARVLAFAEAHLLAQSPMGWIPDINDTPLAVSGETLGPGDDVRLEFGGGIVPVEAQVKHGFNAAGDLDGMLASLTSHSSAGSTISVVAPPSNTSSTTGLSSGMRSPVPPMRVVLVVDRASTRALYTDFAEDLHRLRSGRTDGARETLRRLMRADPSVTTRLERLFVVATDVDQANEPETKFALELLKSVLEDSAQAPLAWDVLVADANNVCAQRLRRDRPALVSILSARGVLVRPPKPEDRWMRQLDFTRDLLRKRHAAVALGRLKQIASELRQSGRAVSSQVQYRLAQQEGSALRLLSRPQEALAALERALDYDAMGVHALSVAAGAAADLGDLVTASHYAARAVESHPDNVTAWTCRVQVARISSEPIEEVPAEVRSATEFRTVMAHVAMTESNWGEALKVTSELLQEGVRTEDVLFCRLSALANAHSTAVPSLMASDEYQIGRLQQLRDVDRLATELLDLISDEMHQFTVPTYVARSYARRLLDREQEAGSDLAEARRIDSEDPEALWHTATSLIDAKRAPEALSLLRHPVVDGDVRLLSLRARLLVDLVQADEARETLTRIERMEVRANVAVDVFTRVTETAILLGDIQHARTALARVPVQSPEIPLVLQTRARLAVAEGLIDTGLGFYREVAKADPSNRLLVLAEAGDALRRAGRSDDAVVVFDDAIGSTDLAALPDEMIARGYASALMGAHRLIRAQEVVDALLTNDEPPSWALALAIEIALLREDPEEAIRHLHALSSREGVYPRVRIDLSRWLVEVGRDDDAMPHILLLGEQQNFTPELRMAVAQLHASVARNEEALAIAFDAFRAGGDQPNLHRAFVSLVLSSTLEPTAYDVIESGTHVRMRRSNGDVRRVTIFADGPIDPRRDEMSEKDAERAGVLGKRVGDVVTRNAGTWQQESWKIEAIMPAIQFAAIDAAENFADRFPNEPFFIAGIKMKDDEPDAIAAIVAALRASDVQRRAHIEGVFRAYRSSILPLGFLAGATGGSVVEVMRFLSHEAATRYEGWTGTGSDSHHDSVSPLVHVTAQHDPEAERSGRVISVIESSTRGPVAPVLLVEWFDRDGQRESLAAAEEASELVITRTAIESLEKLGLHDVVALNYKLVAPRSLRELLRRELREAERNVQQGYTSFSSTPSGLAFFEIAANDSSLLSRRDRANERLSWLAKHVTVESRPLETIPRAGSRESSAREFIGPDSIDSVHLAQHRSSTMYADDLGLRRFFTRGQPGRSTSTIALLSALAARGVITSEQRDNYSVSLLDWRYAMIPASTTMLALVVERAAGLSTVTIRAAFELLAQGESSLAEASNIVGHVLFQLATSSVRVFGIAGVIDLALEVTASRWGSQAAVMSLRREARQRLRLLPLALHEVEARCSRFARA